MTPKDAFAGYWRIDGMEVWNSDHLDLIVPAQITFDRAMAEYW